MSRTQAAINDVLGISVLFLTAFAGVATDVMWLQVNSGTDSRS